MRLRAWSVRVMMIAVAIGFCACARDSDRAVTSASPAIPKQVSPVNSAETPAEPSAAKAASPLSVEDAIAIPTAAAPAAISPRPPRAPVALAPVEASATVTRAPASRVAVIELPMVSDPPPVSQPANIAPAPESPHDSNHELGNEPDLIELGLRLSYGLLRSTAVDGSLRQMASRPAPSLSLATSLPVAERWRARLDASLRRLAYTDATGITTEGSRVSSWSALAGAEYLAHPIFTLRAQGGFGEAYAISSTGSQTQKIERGTRAEARVAARVKLLATERGSLHSEASAIRTFAGKGGAAPAAGSGYGLGLFWVREKDSFLRTRALGVEIQKNSYGSAFGKTSDLQLHIGLTLGMEY